MSRSAANLSGKVFGRLTAVKPLTERESGFVVWECRCECGKTKNVTSRRLVTGGTKSCGCLHRGPRKRNKTT